MLDKICGDRGVNRNASSAPVLMSSYGLLFHEKCISQYINRKFIISFNYCPLFLQITSNKELRAVTFERVGDGEVALVWKNIGKHRRYDSTSDVKSWALS